MSVSEIGNTSVDYSRYKTEQQTIKQESVEQQTEETATVQQTAESRKADTKSGSQTSGQPQAKAQQPATQSGATSAIAQASGKLAEQLETSGSDDGEDDEQALINKASAGSVLTQSELSRLKDADPGLYSRVVKAEQAREELRSQMKQNPSGAKQAAQAAIAQNGSDGQEITRKALADEMKSFTSKFDQVELSGRVMQ